MAQVVSGGELLDIRRPFSSGISHSSGWMRMYGEYNADYATIYRTQPNVRRVISFLANNHAQLKIKAYERVSDDERKHLRDHPAARLIRKPNPFLTRYNYARALMSDLAIYDDAYTVKIRLGGVVRMLLPIPPSWVSFDGNTPLWSSGYKITLAGQDWRIPDEDMIHIHGYNPTDPRRGLSPMEALRRMLAQEDAQGRFQESFWRNNAKHETVITRPATAPKWSETARERFTAEWRKNYAGADNSGKTPVLEEGMDVKTVSVTAKDSEYIASRKFSLEEAAGVYHVSPPLIGLLDEANFGSLTAIYRQHLANTLAPWTVNIQEEFELHLLSEFESPDTSVYMEYNLQEKLRGFFEEEASVLQTATGGPIMTRNEARGRWNLPPVPDGDLLITPLNVLVGGQASPQDSSPNKPDLGPPAPVPNPELPAPKTDDLSVMELTQAMQRIYLAVDKVITADEAREILNRAGAGLSGGLAPAAKRVVARHLDRHARALKRLKGVQADVTDLFSVKKWEVELAEDLDGRADDPGTTARSIIEVVLNASEGSAA